MSRAIELAILGKGNTSPNPMVGAVIVYDHKIIGEGYHEIYGSHHAEVNAVNSVKDKSVLKDATIYVTLEPCSHFGKTPPCSDLLVKHEFKKVVVGCTDPFAKVQGRGIQKLKDAGIEVVFSKLEKECIALNKRFFTFHNKKRPYVILKWAQTQDGFIDKLRDDEKGIFWISEKETKTLTHKWRTEEDAILVGGNTFETDAPKLTAREYSGKHPKRFVLDSRATIVPQEEDFFVLGKLHPKANGFSCELTPQSIASVLYEQEIQSLIVEGGRKTLAEFIESGIWDEARIITGSNQLRKGVEAPKITGSLNETFYFGKDKISIYHNDSNSF